LPTSSTGSTRQQFTKGKAVNKSQLIEALSSRFDGNRKAAQHALESVLDTITREVAKGEKVAITGFGAFEKAVRPARMVRNPRTGERTRAKKTAVPKFRAGAELKAVVSGAKKLPSVAVAAAPTKKTTTAKAAPAKKAAAKKTTAKKTTAKKTTATKKATTAKKTTAKKTTAVKKATTAKKTTARKTTAKKAPARKTAAKKAPAKKATTRKAAAKKAPAKRTTAAKKAPAKNATARKAPAKKATAKKTTAKRAAKKS
jgi:DNA-binding protein HU-beta